MMHTTRVGLAAVALWTAACGGGNGSEIAIDDVGSSLAETSCRRSFECCSAAELSSEYAIFDVNSEDECVQVLGAFAEAFLTPLLQRGVDSGRLVYHADAMGACLELMSSMSCGDLAVAMTAEFPSLVGCTDPFEGRVAIGEACASDMECQSDYCSGDALDFEGNVIEGTCRGAPVDGEACDDFSCGDGAYCQSDAEGGTCRAPQAAGADCFSDDECASGNCDASTCSADLRCDGA